MSGARGWGWGRKYSMLECKGGIIRCTIEKGNTNNIKLYCCSDILYTISMSTAGVVVPTRTVLHAKLITLVAKLSVAGS